MTLVVRRSATRMWLLAMAGVPLLVISLDVLTRRNITNWFRELIFRPEDTQIYEPRDVIWAWVMALFAVFLVGWGLKELFVPTRVVECRDDGLLLKINGPFKPPTAIAWENIVDVRATEMFDEGERLPLLGVRLLSRQGVPDHPWGARWLDQRELGMLAQDWAKSPDVVATEIGDFAVEATRRNARARTASLWKEGEEE